ncbi:hypothetical protein KBC59_02955 [Patescibacteria group bacterium]|nr:hypothetical protein [Patescibacteria group bacterium]
MANWDKLLKSLGFTDSEARIYLLSLEMGPASVQDLAKKAKVSRVTTYTVIEALMKDGLMSTVQKGKKNHYVAESPERLMSFVHTRMKTMDATLKEIEASLQDLKLLQRGEKPIVKLFEGKEGFFSIFDDIVATKPKDIQEFTNANAVRESIPKEEFKDHISQLERLNVTTHALVLSDTPVSGRTKSEVIQLPSDEFSFSSNITVYADKVAFSTFRGKHISILIESAVVADTMRELLKLAREAAKKFKK